jgi:cytochrome oxidase Cu insertion factor (SCO1/SenC/PrrC family)
VIALAVLDVALRAFVPTLQTGDTVPPLPLVDQDGRNFSLADLRGNVVVVTFLYTSCGNPKECPLIAAKFGRMQQLIGDAPIRLVAVTLDPQHDTPTRLRAFGATYSADASRWRLATGAPAVIEELDARLGVTSLVRRSTQGFAHDDAAIVLDRAGRIARVVPGNAWTAGDLLAVARGYAGAPIDARTTIRLWLSSAAERCGGGSGAFTAAGALATLALVFAAIAFAFRRIFVTRSPS